MKCTSTSVDKLSTHICISFWNLNARSELVCKLRCTYFSWETNVLSAWHSCFCKAYLCIKMLFFLVIQQSIRSYLGVREEKEREGLGKCVLLVRTLEDGSARGKQFKHEIIKSTQQTILRLFSVSVLSDRRLCKLTITFQFGIEMCPDTELKWTSHVPSDKFVPTGSPIYYGAILVNCHLVQLTTVQCILNDTLPNVSETVSFEINLFLFRESGRWQEFGMGTSALVVLRVCSPGI